MGNKISYVIACNNEDKLRDNVLASPSLQKRGADVVVQRGFSSAALAYNDGLKRAAGDILVFVHQDVFLPTFWEERLKGFLEKLEKSKTKWGVLGCFGIDIDNNPCGYVYDHSLGRVLGHQNDFKEARNVDELVIVINRCEGLLFDEKLPHFHLYGTDICLMANRRGLKNYIVPDFCIHNGAPKMLKRDYWTCCRYIREKWASNLPLRTTITTMEGRALPRLYHYLQPYSRHFRTMFSREQRRLWELRRKRTKGIDIFEYLVAAQLVVHLETDASLQG